MKIQETIYSVSLLLVGAVLLTGKTLGAESHRPTVSVADTESQLPSWQPAMGSGLAQMMTTELARLKNVQVLESVALNDLREERSLGEGGEIDRSERIRKGAWKAAEYTFKSTITRFGAKESNFGGGGFLRLNGVANSLSIHKSENEVQIDWRIVDNTTRAVIKSGRGTGLEKGSSFSFGNWSNNGFSNNREFLDSALGKATMKAIASIVTDLEEWTPPIRSGRDQLAEKANQTSADVAKTEKEQRRRVKGEVLLVDAGQVWVSLGSDKGFEKGEKLKVYRPIEKKNKQGKLIAVDYEPVAEIELKKVQKEKSCANIPAAVTLEEGWVVVLPTIDVNELD